MTIFAHFFFFIADDVCKREPVKAFWAGLAIWADGRGTLCSVVMPWKNDDIPF